MRSRHGGALLVSLALLALGAALLAGSFAAGRAAQRSVQSREAVLLAGTEVRASIAEFVSQWSGAEDSLAVGAERSLVLGPRPRGSGGVTMRTQLRLRRLSPKRYVVVADCQEVLTMQSSRAAAYAPSWISSGQGIVCLRWPPPHRSGGGQWRTCIESLFWRRFSGNYR